jgi:dipeptidyl aminopeptidase/acylaminoacyl peptidase
LTHDNDGYFTPDWSPDGQKILCVSNEGRPLLGWSSGPTNLYSIDVATGLKSAMTSDSIYKRIPSWSPDGKSIAYLGAGAENFGKVYLFVVSRDGGKPLNLTAQLDRRVREAHWFSDSKSLAINYWNGVDSPIAKIDMRTGDTAVLTGNRSAARATFSISRTGEIAWSQSDGTNPASIYMVQKAAAERLVDLTPEIKDLKLGSQEVISWKNERGSEREGIVIKPPDYVEGRRYPIIVDAYPKLQNSFKGSPMMPGQAWASRGYVVFYPNADGPHVWENPWKSIKSDAEAKGPNGVNIAVDDIVSGVNALVTLGLADADRMCIYGFSNGGGIVNHVVTKTNLFKCAISVAPALSVDWTTSFLLYTHSNLIPRLAGTTPWDNPQTYIQLSAIYRLDKLKTPMLLANGDDDLGSLLPQVEMYNGLRYLGRQVTLLRYPNQGHGFEGYAMKDFWRRENEFIDRHLQGCERSDAKQSRNDLPPAAAE